MANLFTHLIFDLSVYLDEDELIQLSLATTLSLFSGLNNLKFKRFIPSIIEADNLDLDYMKILSPKVILREMKKIKDINLKDELGLTMLHKIVLNDNLDMLKILIKIGANVNAVDDKGHTPVHRYIRLKGRNVSLEVIKLFVMTGTDISLKNINGESAIFDAVKRCRDHINKFLLDISIQKGYKETPIHVAVETTNINAVYFLVSNIDCQTFTELTKCIDWLEISKIAWRKSNPNIIDYLYDECLLYNKSQF